MDPEGQGKQKAPLTELIFISAFIAAGVALEFFTGGFDFSLISFPVNILLTLIIILFATVREKSPISGFGKPPVSVVLISLILVLSVLMGLIPGNTIKSSWPFALVYLLLLISLSMTIGRRLRRFRLSDAGFLLNHFGLLLLLIATGLGRGDHKRYLLTVPEGKVEWRGENRWNGRTEELPVAVQLNDFKMELYPPRVLIINRVTGEQQGGRDRSFTEAKTGNSFCVRNYTIRVDSVPDRERYAPAAYITIINSESDSTTAGWISCGNYFQLSKRIVLDDSLDAVLTVPEASSYSSDVDIFTKRGTTKSGKVSVNHPLSASSWKLYQYSYDTMMGRDSEYSVFELVHDPWILPSYAGIIMMLLGAVTLFWKGGKR